MRITQLLLIGFGAFMLALIIPGISWWNFILAGAWGLFVGLLTDLLETKRNNK